MSEGVSKRDAATANQRQRVKSNKIRENGPGKWSGLKNGTLFVILHAYIWKNEETNSKARGSMIKKIDILGMQVDNYTVREAILQLDTYMNSTVLNIIETVTMKQLMQAVENPKVRACIEQADLSVIGESEILSETGAVSVQRMREIRDRDFTNKFLRRVVRNQKRIFLIAMTREDVEHMQAFFEEKNPKFTVAGSYAMEECVGDPDSVVNYINGTTPDVIISSMASPDEEAFVLDHKDKICASVWYGVGTDYDKKSGGVQVGSMLKRLMMRGKLHHTLSRYQVESKSKK